MEPRSATGGFEAGASEPGEDRVATDGDVTTGMVGLDAERDRALAGVMFQLAQRRQPRHERRSRLDAFVVGHRDFDGDFEGQLTGLDGDAQPLLSPFELQPEVPDVPREYPNQDMCCNTGQTICS